MPVISPFDSENNSGHPPDRFKSIEIPQVVDEKGKELYEGEGYVRKSKNIKKRNISVQRTSIRSKQDNFQVICATCWENRGRVAEARGDRKWKLFQYLFFQTLPLV